jgi:hypothetical protein
MKEILGSDPSLTRESDATEYLEKHKVFDLLANLTSQLVFKRPGKAAYSLKLKIISHFAKLYLQLD